MVMRISKANPLWVFTDTPLENCTQHVVNIHIKTQYEESLVVEVDVHYKPHKARKLLLLLLRHDDKSIFGVPRSVWRWSG
jgi:hypothetical protein